MEARAHLKYEPAVIKNAMFSGYETVAPVVSFSQVVPVANLTKTGTTFAYTFTSITKGLHYHVMVSAKNTQAYSPLSDAGISADMVFAPTSPTGLTAVVVGTERDALSIQLDWTAPDNDGGAAIAKYLMMAQRVGANTETVLTTTTSLLVSELLLLSNSDARTPLLAGSTYSFQVQGSNDASLIGPFSNQETLVLAIAPGAPLLSYTITSATTVDVVLSPPEMPRGDGGLPLQNYTLTVNGVDQAVVVTPGQEANPVNMFLIKCVV